MGKRKEINFPLVVLLAGIAILLVATAGAQTGATISRLDLPSHLAAPDITCALNAGGKVLGSSIIGSKTFFEKDESIPLNIRISNRGGASAGAFNYALYLDNKPLKTELPGKLDGIALKAQVPLLSITLPALSVGRHTISMSTDTNNAVGEISEGNNNCVLTLVVG